MSHCRKKITPGDAIASPVVAIIVFCAIILCGISSASPVEARQSSTGSGEQRSFREQIVKLLYGDQWALGEYCSSNLTAREKLANDEQIELLYNGTYLGSLDGASDWHQVAERLVASISVGSMSRRELEILCSASSWGYASAQEEQLANEPRRDDDECTRQLERLHTFVATLTNLTLTTSELRETLGGFSLHHYEQLHSFGRLPSGPPHRQHLLPGDYDTCARLKSTRYCLGSYGPGGKHRGGLDLAHANLYQIGMCLPRACSSDRLRRSSKLMGLLNSIVHVNLRDAASTIAPRIHAPPYELRDIFCPPAKDSLYMTRFSGDWTSALLLFLGLPWILTLLYATLRGAPRESRTMSLFDLSRSWQKFWTCSSSSSRELDSQLAGLSAVKTIGMIWMMITHVSMAIAPYVKNYDELASYYGTTLQGPLVLQAQHVVPAFFIISGLLVGFKYLPVLRKVNDRHGVSFKKMILMRYLRLLPMYLIVWAYVKHFGHLLGDGPLWDSGVSAQSVVRQCRLESWWVPLLMLANFTPPFGHCLLTGWHIANDFQIYLVLPLLLVAYGHSRVLGLLVAFVTFLVCHASHVWLWGTSDNYDLLKLMRDPARFGPRTLLDRMALDYVNPLGRVGTYFLGVVLADLLLEGRARIVNGECKGSSTASKSNGKLADSSEATADTERVNSCDKNQDCHSDKIAVKQGKRDERRGSSTSSGGSTSQQWHDAHGDPQEAFSLTNDDMSGKTEKGSRLRLTHPLEEKPAPQHNQRATSLSDKGIKRGVSFMDSCVLLLASSAFAFVMLSLLLPADKKAARFGAYTKAVAYPLARLLIELSWSVLLYYLLRGNYSASGAKCDSDSIRREEFGLVRFLKSPLWNVPAKLNYAIMLTHYSIMRFFIQSQRDLFYFTWVNFTQLSIFLLLSCYLIALVIHLAIEIPLTTLVRMYIL